MYHPIRAIFIREVKSYFTTPIAYISMIIFLMMYGIYTFYIGMFFERGQADLTPFFEGHPWIYLILIPTITMKTWAEERKSGTIELLLTLPVSSAQAIIGKFLAAWLFLNIIISLTFPMWLTVTYLGQPDNGTILISYMASSLLAGAIIAIGLAFSSLTKNQVIAYITTLIITLILMLSGYPLVTDYISNWGNAIIVDSISSYSLISNYAELTKGLVDLKNLIYFTSLIIFFLFIRC